MIKDSERANEAVLLTMATLCVLFIAAMIVWGLVAAFIYSPLLFVSIFGGCALVFALWFYFYKYSKIRIL